MTIAFFYGSLREGYWNNVKWISTKAKKLGDSELPGYKLCVGNKSGIPCVVPAEGASVKGEIWSITQIDAGNVDFLESGYKKLVLPFMVNGKLEPACFYYQDHPSKCSYLSGGYTVISNGDYTTFIGKDGKKL